MRIEFNKLRPCIIISANQKGLCHGIFQNSEIYKPSVMVGGHPGGVAASPVAVVEVEDGYLEMISPLDIKFIEDKFEEYDFTVPDKKKEKENG